MADKDREKGLNYSITRRKFLKGTVVLGGATLIGGLSLASRKKDVWAEQKGPIKLGFITSYSGPYGTIANEQLKGLKLALDEVNVKGGVLGRQVEVVDRDDKLHPGEAVKKFKELVEKEKIDIMMGTLSAATLVAVNEQTKKLNMLL